jgi:NAD(P)-dependent dehydrogenase (short-subunit alcohol dehydrogenase family)
MQFEGRTALITGAAGVLGRAVAARFAAAGARLVLADLSRAALQAAFPAVDPEFLCEDVLDSRQLSNQLAKAGRIDIVCNIAGGFTMGPPVHETSDDTWLRMMEINARSVMSAARAVVPRMMAQREGWIVNVAAGAATRGGAGMGAYAASKSAVMRLTESMSAELRDFGIHVNCVSPSIIDTPRNREDMPGVDFSRWVSPEALAEVIAFLASPAARAVHGACIPVTNLT